MRKLSLKSSANIYPEFANNIAEELEELVCDHAAGLFITDALGVDVVETCMTAHRGTGARGPFRLRC